MPGCAAIGCNNRSEKGFTMKCFPREPLLRAIWKHRVGRADWEPSNNSFLCHAHFESNQRQITQDGKIKLKRDALPSVFTITSTRKSIRKRSKEQDDSINPDQHVTECPVIPEKNNQQNIPVIATGNAQKQIPTNIEGLVLQYTNFISSSTLRNLENENILIVAKKSKQGAGNVLNVEKVSVLEVERVKENTKIPQNSNKSIPSKVKLEVKEEMSENLLGACEDGKQKKQKMIESSSCVIDMSNDAEDTSCVNNEPSIESCSSSNDDEPGVSANESAQGLISRSLLNIGRKRKRKIKTELNRDSDEILDTTFSSNELIEDSAENIHDPGNQLKFNSNPERRAHKLKVPPAIKNIEDNLQMIIKLRRDCPNRKGIGTNSQSEKVEENQKMDNYDQSTSQKLMTKVNVQAEVIEKLTNQLIMYKDMERGMKSLTGSLEVKNSEVEILNKRIYNKECQSKEDDINDTNLKGKVKILEEQNKQLEEIITLENQNKQKMECQIKNQINVIRELDWKLKRTSKSLCQAEKKIEHYKQKMLSIQRLLQKKNPSCNDSVFEDFLLNHAQQNFSENNLKIALEIEKECGIDGYQKLLNYRFPLPSLRELNETYPDDVEYYEIITSEGAIKGEKICGKTSGLSMAFIKPEAIEYLNSDTATRTNNSVTKTVQDLLNEINDDEDMDLNELQKHIMFN